MSPDPTTRLVNILTPMTKIPVMLRGGHIIPRRDRIRRTSTLMRADPFTLVVALDENGNASGSVYDDDGSGYGHEGGGYVYGGFVFEGGVLKGNGLGVEGWGKGVGGAGVGGRVERVIVVGLEGVKNVWAEGEEGKRELGWKMDGGAVVVKDPKVLVGSTFSITFE